MVVCINVTQGVPEAHPPPLPVGDPHLSLKDPWIFVMLSGGRYNPKRRPHAFKTPWILKRSKPYFALGVVILCRYLLLGLAQVDSFCDKKISLSQ